jgi:hypothetical protein
LYLGAPDWAKAELKEIIRQEKVAKKKGIQL